MDYILYFVLLIIIIWYLVHNDKFEFFKNKCRESTFNNPYMNYMLYYKDTDIKACNSKKNDIKIKENVNKHIHFDANNIWGKCLADRFFYTLPNTNKINDRSEFAKILFKL